MEAGMPMKQNLAIAYAMKKKAKKMADGGYVREEKSTGYNQMPEGHDEDDDMISRIMHRRMMSEGGMIANQDHGKNDDELADFKPNEFDDLSMRDDLESDYTGANSGDEIGNATEDENERDMISRIMRSRKLKDKMPRPM